MKLGHYRRMTSDELEPFRDRPWVAWGKDRDPRFFRLEGVSLHVESHPEPLLFVWSFAAANDDDRGTPVFSHVPYPHALPAELRRSVMDLQAYGGGFSGFLHFVAKRATLLD